MSNWKCGPEVSRQRQGIQSTFDWQDKWSDIDQGKGPKSLSWLEKKKSQFH